MFQMKSKKFLTAILALSAVGMLAGCDDIVALPANYEEPILKNEDDSKLDVYDNMMGLLYDSVVGSKNDTVLNEFIDIISKDQYGEWSEINSICKDKDITTIDAAAADAFIAKHEKMFKRESDASLATSTGSTVEVIARQRLLNLYDAIWERIYNSLYSEVSSSTYTKDGKFLEIKFAYAHFGELYKVNLQRNDWKSGYVIPELSKKDNVKALIKLDGNDYDDYITRKILPTLFRDKLVEEYLYNNYYSTLGRSYARKVNTIKISAPSDNKDKQDLPFTIMKSYVNKYVYTESDVTLDDLANAWRGFQGLNADGTIKDLDAQEIIILINAGLSQTKTTTLPSGASYTYYVNTELGTLLDKWDLVKDITVDGDRTPDGEEGTNGKVSAALNLFTGNNAYPKSVGFAKELATLSAKDYTNDGWYVKNGGLTDLPADSIRNRLFNINVSNNVDDESITNETGLPSEDFINSFDQTKQYVRKINGKYYLIPDKFEKSSFATNMIIVNGSDYYIVNVEEAPSTSKLNLDSGYAKMDSHKNEPLFTEKVAFEIAKVLGNKDSYTNSAYASYIKEYSIAFHDTSIYDYFKEKFPELFE